MTTAAEPRILVVDDTPANLLVMRRLLSKSGAVLVEAASGQEALSACLDQEFALILLDVNMPGMDGFETAELIAEEPNNRLTPVIFVTAAYNDDVNRLRGYHAGAVDYIAKPINEEILKSKVRVFLELWAARQEIKRYAARLDERNQRLEHEVREREKAEAEARHQAHHDPLTGLPNRLLFLDRLDTAIDRAARQRNNFALLYVDIDGFKPVNDIHGHAMGDVLLQQIAARLLECVRRSDTVARLGGDEFAVILEGITDPQEAQRMGQSLVDCLGKAFRLEGESQLAVVKIGGSVGLAIYPEHGGERGPLLTAADAAMYRAKRSGRNQCALAAV